MCAVGEKKSKIICSWGHPAAAILLSWLKSRCAWFLCYFFKHTHNIRNVSFCFALQRQFLIQMLLNEETRPSELPDSEIMWVHLIVFANNDPVPNFVVGSLAQEHLGFHSCMAECWMNPPISTTSTIEMGFQDGPNECSPTLRPLNINWHKSFVSFPHSLLNRKK